MKNFGYFLYLLALGIWIGGILIFTFVVTPVIFRSFDRDMAASIVGRLFSGYFFFTLVVVALAAALLIFVRSVHTGSAFAISCGLAVIALVIALYTNFSLHPRMQKVKQEIASFETVPPDHPSRLEFRRLHMQSAVLNILLLADGVALLALAAFSRK
jgi:putative copper export protein